MNSEAAVKKTPAAPSFRKKLLFSFLLLLLMYGFAELISYGTFRILSGKFSFSEIQAQRNGITSPETTNTGGNYGINRNNWNVIHPYLGFITEGIDPNRVCEDGQNCDRRARSYEDMPFVESNDNNVIVGVLGGSFAHGVSTTSNILQHALTKVPQYKGKEIIMIHMAVGGYKQPQQLMKFNYFLALGAQFDVIINIDGFNEIAIPGTENLPKGVHPLYPRSWYYFVDGALNDDMLSLYGIRAYAKKQQVQYAAFFSSPFIRYSVTGNLLWKLINRNIISKISHADVSLIEYKESDANKRRYVATGPDYTFTSSKHFYQDMAEVWARSSALIYNQCLELGIEYYHFLQPNQHVKGSKPMFEKEKAIAFSDRSLYGKAATEGYPYLIERGKKLKTEGIPYYDLKFPRNYVAPGENS
ncbi:MAG: hypothetical protein K9K37_12340 [Desulfocapsa sp.]|nr:hypothetical protein [Desulfocapsa sp.]